MTVPKFGLVIYHFTTMNQDAWTDKFDVPLLIDLETLARIDNPDEWSEASKMVGKSVLNKVREIING